MKTEKSGLRGGKSSMIALDMQKQVNLPVQTIAAMINNGYTLQVWEDGTFAFVRAAKFVVGQSLERCQSREPDRSYPNQCKFHKQHQGQHSARQKKWD